MDSYPGRPITPDTIAMQTQNELLNSFSPSPSRRDSDDLKVKLQSTLDSVQGCITQMEHSVQLAEELLRDTKSKLFDLQLQMVDVRTSVDKICSRKRSAGVAGLDKKYSPVARRVHFGGEPSSSSFRSAMPDNDPPVDELKAICSDMSGRDAEVVTQAAQEAKGVLSLHNFLSFLYLSRQVDNPVQLAKVSFTSETTPLYYQLRTFLHKLEALNKSIQEAEGVSQIDHTVEDKFKRLVEDFRNHLPESD